MEKIAAREIKFRGWHSKMKKMFSPYEMAADQLTLLPTGSFINVHGNRTQDSTIYQSDKFIPLQFTGLTDKNGKEIYEGDIVRCVALGNINPELNQYRYIVVKETEDGGCWEEISHGMVKGRQRPSWEVCGNVYENPEMLAAREGTK